MLRSVLSHIRGDIIVVTLMNIPEVLMFAVSSISMKVFLDSISTRVVMDENSASMHYLILLIFIYCASRITVVFWQQQNSMYTAKVFKQIRAILQFEIYAKVLRYPEQPTHRDANGEKKMDDSNTGKIHSLISKDIENCMSDLLFCRLLF